MAVNEQIRDFAQIPINGREMRAPTMLRKKETVHYAAVPVGARIARPHFMLNLLFAHVLKYGKLKI